MTISVLLFARLKTDYPTAENQIPYQKDMTVADVWTACIGDSSIPNNTLVAKNQEFTSFTATISDGDEIAFFPPVTGG